MIPTVRARVLRTVLLALGTSLAACAPDEVTGPDAGTVGAVRLEVIGGTTLASLGDTVVVTPRVTTRRGDVTTAEGMTTQLSASGVLEPLGGGRYRAIGNGQVILRTAVDTAWSGVVPGGYYVNGTTDSVVVTVQQVPVSLTIQTTVDTLFAAVDELRPLVVRLADARGNALLANAAPITFTSADSAVVRVNASGVLQSLRDGVTAVTVRSGSLSASRTFAVRATRQHVSCMSYTRRRKTQTSCVSVDFVVRSRTAVTP